MVAYTCFLCHGFQQRRLLRHNSLLSKGNDDLSGNAIIHTERDHKPLHKRPMYERSTLAIRMRMIQITCPARFTMRTMVENPRRGFQFPYSSKVNDGQPSYRNSVQEGLRWTSQQGTRWERIRDVDAQKVSMDDVQEGKRWIPNSSRRVLKRNKRPHQPLL